jgi:hypothetical protein
MPRLTTPTYLFHYYQLKALWAEDQVRFSYLSPKDQLALHKYYLFALEKTELELVAHRRDVHLGDPSLPQRAGRAYTKLTRGEKAKVGYSVTPSGRAISIRTVVRPTPDAKLLARVYWQMAIRDIEEEKQAHQSLSDSASGAPERKE